jgi:hypothetical protein
MPFNMGRWWDVCPGRRIKGDDLAAQIRIILELQRSLFSDLGIKPG